MFRGPAYANVDFSVTKIFKFGDRLSAQFRAEFFNLFNHPNISNPFGGPGETTLYRSYGSCRSEFRLSAHNVGRD